jgi:hypothetical protein
MVRIEATCALGVLALWPQMHSGAGSMDYGFHTKVTGKLMRIVCAR